MTTSIEAKQLMADAKRLAAWGRQQGLIEKPPAMGTGGEVIGPFIVRVTENPNHTYTARCEGLSRTAETAQLAVLATGERLIAKVLHGLGRQGARRPVAEIVSPGVWRTYAAMD